MELVHKGCSPWLERPSRGRADPAKPSGVCKSASSGALVCGSPVFQVLTLLVWRSRHGTVVVQVSR